MTGLGMTHAIPTPPPVSGRELSLQSITPADVFARVELVRKELDDLVAVGLGALLISFSSVYQKEVDVLTARLEASQGESSGFKEQGNPEANAALIKQKAEISQRLESLTLSLRHSLVSVLLLLFFLTLLTCRIFLWSWQRPPDARQSRGPGRFFWFDRALVSVLVILFSTFVCRTSC